MDKNKKRINKHLFPFFIIYYVCVITFVSIGDPTVNVYIKILLIFVSVFLISFQVGNILVKKYNNNFKFLVWTSRVYDVVSNWKHNPFLKSPKKQKIPWTNFIPLFILIIIPMTFIPVLTQGRWSLSASIVSSGTYLGDKGLNQYKVNGQVIINPKVDLNFMQKLSYFIGKDIIELSPLDLCFTNKGTTPTYNPNYTFQSKVMINKEIEINVPYKGKSCIPYDRKKPIIGYEWTTSIESPIRWLNLSNQLIPDYSANPENKTVVEVNYGNLLIIFLILLIAWWTFWILLFKVVEYIYNGINLKKK